MKSWYSTRDGSNLSHGNVAIKPGQKIFITEAQAKLHGDKVEKSEAPTTSDDAGVKAEFEEWQQSLSSAPKEKPKDKSSKEQGASSK